MVLPVLFGELSLAGGGQLRFVFLQALSHLPPLGIRAEFLGVCLTRLVPLAGFLNAILASGGGELPHVLLQARPNATAARLHALAEPLRILPAWSFFPLRPRRGGKEPQREYQS